LALPFTPEPSKRGGAAGSDWKGLLNEAGRTAGRNAMEDCADVILDEIIRH